MDEKRRKQLLIGLGIFIVLVCVVAIYFTFFYHYRCDDLSCYREHQRRCNFISAKTIYIHEVEDVTWRYNIRRQVDDTCRVEVTLLQVKQGDPELETLSGLSMTCYVPLGSIASPEADLTQCHGILKEELQGQLINRLHQYILDNLGEISEELANSV